MDWRDPGLCGEASRVIRASGDWPAGSEVEWHELVHGAGEKRAGRSSSLAGKTEGGGRNVDGADPRVRERERGRGRTAGLLRCILGRLSARPHAAVLGWRRSGSAGPRWLLRDRAACGVMERAAVYWARRVGREEEAGLGRAGAWAGLVSRFSSFPISFPFLFLIQTKLNLLEFKFEFEFKPHSIK